MVSDESLVMSVPRESKTLIQLIVENKLLQSDSAPSVSTFRLPNAPDFTTCDEAIFA